MQIKYAILYMAFSTINVSYGGDTPWIAVLSSHKKTTRLGDIYSDKKGGEWIDIERRIRDGADFSAQMHCGKLLKVRHFDNQGSVKGAVEAIKLAENQGASAIVGFLDSTSILSVNQIYRERSIPLVTLMATHIDVAKVTPPTLQLSYNDSNQGQALAQEIQAATKKDGLVLVITEATNAFSVGLSRIVTKELERKKINFKEYTYVTPFSWRAQTWNHDDFKLADTIAMTGEGQEVLELIQNLTSLNRKYTLIGGDGWDVSDMASYIDMAKILPRVITLGHWTPRFLDRRSVDFTAHYRKLFSYTPAASSALAHDAVKTICEVFRLKKKLDFDSFIGLTIHGVTGKIAFDSDGRQKFIKPTIHFFEHGKSRRLGGLTDIFL